MDNDKLQKATQLKDTIESVEKQKRIWDGSNKLNSVSINWNYPGGSTNDTVMLSYINFEVLKTLTLDTINKRLSELKKQYAEL